MPGTQEFLDQFEHPGDLINLSAADVARLLLISFDVTQNRGISLRASSAINGCKSSRAILESRSASKSSCSRIRSP